MFQFLQLAWMFAALALRLLHTLLGNVNIDPNWWLVPITLWMLVSDGAPVKPLPGLLRCRNGFGSPDMVIQN